MQYAFIYGSICINGLGCLICTHSYLISWLAVDE
jgi:hypothetical protein